MWGIVFHVHLSFLEGFFLPLLIFLFFLCRFSGLQFGPPCFFLKLESLLNLFNSAVIAVSYSYFADGAPHSPFSFRIIYLLRANCISSSGSKSLPSRYASSFCEYTWRSCCLRWLYSSWRFSLLGRQRFPREHLDSPWHSWHACWTTQCSNWLLPCSFPSCLWKLSMEVVYGRTKLVSRRSCIDDRLLY